MRAALLAALTLTLLPGCAPRSGSAPAPTVRPDGVLVYGRADFRWPLRTLEGRPVQLESLRGRVLFINLWATWCPPCVGELAGIQRLRDGLRDTDVEFLLVSPEDAETVRRFLRRQDRDLPVLLEGAPMPAAWGFRAVPTTWIVDRGGDIVLRHRGAAEWDREPIRALLRALSRG